MEIRTKKTFYRLWHSGLLGNRPHTWHTVEALRRSGWTGRVGIRSVERGGPSQYHLTVEDALTAARDWPCQPTFSEALPDHLLLLQGEVARLETGMHLTYSTERGLTMREAMRRPLVATGITAKVILEACLWPASFEELTCLLDDYPDAVVEFGAHECAVGVLPHRNTIIWEVRNY